MPESTAEMAGALSRATSGADTPGHVTVRRPAREAMWCQIGALVFACAAAASVIAYFAFSRRPPNEAIWLRRDWFLGWMGLSLIGCIALVTLSQFFSRVDASAGPGSIHLGGGDER